MNHALARVAIKVINNGYTGEAKLSTIEFGDATIANSGTLNAIDGSITASKAVEVALSVPAAEQTIATGDGTTYECLLVPSEIKNGRQDVGLYLTIDGQGKSLYLSGNNGVIFKPGVKSTVTITLSNKGIALKSVSINDWNIVEVGGHKVTVKRSSEDGIADDVFLDVTSNGSTVTIKTLSATGRFTQCTCTPSGKATCTPSIDATTGICTFTITDVQDDITAEVGYLKYNATVEYDSDMGSVKLNGVAVASGTPVQIFYGEEVKLLAEAKSGCGFVKWTDGNDNDLSTDNPYEFTVPQSASYVAVFRLNDALSGVFTVAADGQGKPTKKVLFSKGNLYCSGVEFNEDGTVKSIANAQWGFEANQYDTTPSSDGDRVKDHISHFMWCADATNAMALNYEEGWKKDETFFAAKNFTVNGYSGWSVLTGGNGGEWEYLLNKRKTKYGTGELSESNHRYAAVQVNDMAGLLLFPDDFSSWPSGAGEEPQTFNTNSSTWNGKNYLVAEFTVLQNNGCVFLPAAGFRSGLGSARVNNVDLIGYYCSASPDGVNLAYALSFKSGEVVAQDFFARSNAQSVRLVTECQSEPSAE